MQPIRCGRRLLRCFYKIYCIHSSIKIPGSFLCRFAWLPLATPLTVLITIAGYPLFFKSGPFRLNAKTIMTALLIGFSILSYSSSAVGPPPVQKIPTNASINNYMQLTKSPTRKSSPFTVSSAAAESVPATSVRISWPESREEKSMNIPNSWAKCANDR